QVRSPVLANCTERRITDILHRSQQKRKIAEVDIANCHHPSKQQPGIKSWLPCLYLPAKLTYFRKMLDYQFGAPRERSPAINLIVIFLMVGLGFVILGPIVGYLIAMPFYNGQLDLL